MNQTSAARRLLANLRPRTIRHRLLLAFLLIVLIPAVAFGVTSAAVGLGAAVHSRTAKIEGEPALLAGNAPLDGTIG
jgi:hypothetical protein